jgi:hypothetical protein
MREIRSSGSVEGVMSNHDSYSDFLWFVSAGCGTGLPGGCVVATTSQGDWTGSGERDHSYVWGKDPYLEEARSGSRQGERASEGRWCLERGTLNADRRI